jgi:hypothetical protein
VKFLFYQMLTAVKVSNENWPFSVWMYIEYRVTLLSNIILTVSYYFPVSPW